MVRSSAWFCPLAVIACLVAASAAAQDVDYSLTSDKTRYYRGEPVAIEAKVCNNTADPQTYLTGPTCGYIDLQIKRGGETIAQHAVEHDTACPAVVFRVELQPGECDRVFRTTWQQRAGGFPFPGNGRQVVSGHYEAVSWAGSAAFHLRQEVQPVPGLSGLATWLLSLLVSIVAWRSITRR